MNLVNSFLFGGGGGGGVPSNVALNSSGAVWDASETYPTYTPTACGDGLTTFTGTPSETYFEGTPPTALAKIWLRCTFPSAKVVTDIVIRWGASSLASQAFVIQYHDGSTFQDVSGTNTTGNSSATNTFSGLSIPSTTQIRVLISQGCTADSCTYCVEIEMTGT